MKTFLDCDGEGNLLFSGFVQVGGLQASLKSPVTRFEVSKQVRPIQSVVIDDVRCPFPGVPAP